jgi:hypothetical protein
MRVGCFVPPLRDLATLGNPATNSPLPRDHYAGLPPDAENGAPAHFRRQRHMLCHRLFIDLWHDRDTQCHTIDESCSDEDDFTW